MAKAKHTLSATLSVSTKTGDQGETGLANGQRLGKDALLFEVLGTSDELSSWLGLCVVELPKEWQAQRQLLWSIQEQLFHIGAELAGSTKTKLSASALPDLEALENKWQAELSDAWTTKFLFPGGSAPAAYLDVARTVARRLERHVVALHRQQPVRPVVLQYLNRLSDCLYVMRCWANDQLQQQEQQFVVESGK